MAEPEDNEYQGGILAEEDNLSDTDIDPYQPIIPDSDSDAPEEQHSSSESEEEVLDDFDRNDENNYYESKDPVVKWCERAPVQRGRPQAANIVASSTVVPQHIEKAIDAFKFTFPEEFIEIVLRYTNQK